VRQLCPICAVLISSGLDETKFSATGLLQVSHSISWLGKQQNSYFHPLFERALNLTVLIFIVLVTLYQTGQSPGLLIHIPLRNIAARTKRNLLPVIIHRHPDYGYAFSLDATLYARYFTNFASNVVYHA